MTTGHWVVFEGPLGGAPSRYINPITEELGVLAKTFEDLQDSRKRAAQRGMDAIADELLRLEERVSRQLGKRLKQHELWPFLEPLTGLSGPLTARAVSMIQDPWRFPGQPCTEGHILRPVFPAGAPCPVTAEGTGESDPPLGGDAPTDESAESESPLGGGEFSGTTERRPEIDARLGGASPTTGLAVESDVRIGCGGVLLEPRAGSGVRSLWHYAGLHATPEGRLPQRRKGVVADWKPALRTIALQKLGLAHQIVNHRTPKYRDIYDETKASKLLADYPKGRAEKIARTVAVKAFLGDLLIEWKRVTS